MSNNSMQTNKRQIRRNVVVSRWLSPIEGFVAFPEVAEPIVKIDYEKNIEDLNLSIDKNEIVLAHETDKSSARYIMDEGFKPSKGGLSPLRERAVFGWLHTDNIGLFREEFKECRSVVLFKANRDMVYASSYETSAYLRGLGEIDEIEYEKNHVLKFNKYEYVLSEYPEFTDHLVESYDNLIYNRISD